MKRLIVSMFLLAAVLSANAQITLNPFGEYEYKQVHQFTGVPAESLYECTLVALSDIFYDRPSEFRYDVMTDGIIVYKDGGGFDIDGQGFIFDYKFKARFKEGRVQYSFTVKRIHHWDFYVEMKDITPDHKDRTIRKYHADIIDNIDKKIKSLYQDLVNYTQLAINDSNF